MEKNVKKQKLIKPFLLTPELLRFIEIKNMAHCCNPCCLQTNFTEIRQKKFKDCAMIRCSECFYNYKNILNVYKYRNKVNEQTKIY